MTNFAVTSFEDSMAGFHFFAGTGKFLYFVNNISLWRTDGTETGTYMITDLHQPRAVSYFTSTAVLNGVLYFAAFDNIHGVELWRSNGTIEGTYLFKDLTTAPNSGMSIPRDFIMINNCIYFTADDGIHGRELWKSDGTEAGTAMVKDLTPNGGSELSELTNVRGTLYFLLQGALWKSDGTETSTVPLKAIEKESGSCPSSLTSFNKKLFFAANDGTHGNELWKTDNTEPGTSMVKDIEPKVDSNPKGDSIPKSLTIAGSTLYFAAYSGLWKTDGTESGTTKVPDGCYYQRELTDFKETLYYIASDEIHAGSLWKSNGTLQGTRMVKDITWLWVPLLRRILSPFAFGPMYLTPVNDILYFSYGVLIPNGAGNFMRLGMGLWRSNGTKLGTYLVKEFVLPVEYLTNVNGTFFFRADDGIHGLELWKVAGPWSPPVLVKDINPAGDANPGQLTNVNGTLYFTTIYGLWKSDGTEAGTVLVKSIAATNLTNVSGTLFFTADDGIHGLELWKSDGTEAGTVMVKDINPDGDSSPGDFTAINGKLCFSANDGVHDIEPWVSDGTGAGTVMIAGINPDGSSYPDSFIQVDNTVYFSADDGSHGRELWKTTVTE